MGSEFEARWRHHYYCGSSGGPWAHNPKVEAGFNSLTRNQSQMPSTIHAPVRYPVSRPLSESGVSVRSTRTWGTNCTAHPVPFSVGLWGDREGHDQPSPKRSREDLGELSGMASHPFGRRARPRPRGCLGSNPGLTVNDSRARAQAGLQIQPGGVRFPGGSPGLLPPNSNLVERSPDKREGLGSIPRVATIHGSKVLRRDTRGWHPREPG